MGVGIGRGYRYRPSSSSYDRPTYSPPASPNPNPNDYKLIRVEEIGKFVLVELKYNGCTNYEGKKILLYKDVSVLQLWQQKSLDPHFSNSKTMISPIARFVPTEEGWSMAKQLAQQLSR